MNSNKFFLYVRRFNALVPSLVLLLMAALMVWAISSDTRGSHAKTLVPPGQDAQSVDNPLELRWLDVDVGPAHSLMQVVQITGSRTRYGPREESRNLVVIGVDTGTVNWVFPAKRRRYPTSKHSGTRGKPRRACTWRRRTPTMPPRRLRNV